MKRREWFRMIFILIGLLVTLLVFYVAAISLFGFENRVAMAVHFGRVSLGMAVLVLFLRALVVVFLEMPPPARDFLIIGLILNAFSSEGFSFLNELGRIFGFDRDVFTSEVAGFFSLVLVVSWVFCMIAPIYGKKKDKLVTWWQWAASVVIGVVTGGALVFVAPLFR